MMMETTGSGALIVVIVMAVVTLATRWGGVFVMSFVPINARTEQFISAMSGSVLVALLAPLAPAPTQPQPLIEPDLPPGSLAPIRPVQGYGPDPAATPGGPGAPIEPQVEIYQPAPPRASRPEALLRDCDASERPRADGAYGRRSHHRQR